MTSSPSSSPEADEPNPVDGTPPPPSPSPPMSTTAVAGAGGAKSILRDIQDKTDNFLESKEIRDATSAQEFLTQNTLKLIGKTYAFILVVLGMFLAVALVRESIVQVILPVITLIVGGVLGFLSKDILRGNNDTSPPSPSPNR